MSVAHAPQAPLPAFDGAHGARLLLTDARVALLVLNDERCRAMERLLGVPKDQVNLATAVAALAVADALHARTKRLLKTPGPSVTDLALGGSSLREGLYAITGQSASDRPLVGTLIALGVIGSLARPVARGTVRAVRASSRQLHSGFNRRYGQVIRHGQLQLSRAKRAGRKPLAGPRVPREQRQAAAPRVPREQREVALV